MLYTYYREIWLLVTKELREMPPFYFTVFAYPTNNISVSKEVDDQQYNLAIQYKITMPNGTIKEDCVLGLTSPNTLV